MIATPLRATRRAREYEFFREPKRQGHHPVDCVCLIRVAEKVTYGSVPIMESIGAPDLPKIPENLSHVAGAASRL